MTVHVAVLDRSRFDLAMRVRAERVTVVRGTSGERGAYQDRLSVPRALIRVLDAELETEAQRWRAM